LLKSSIWTASFGQSSLEGLNLTSVKKLSGFLQVGVIASFLTTFQLVPNVTNLCTLNI